MIEEIVADLMVKLHDEPDLTEEIIRITVKNVVRELRSRRNYAKVPRLSEDDIIKDMENYYTNVYNVSEYDCVRLGVEGEIGHSENGISRQYREREKLWDGVYAYCYIPM